MIFSLIEGCIRNVGGRFGVIIRRIYYISRLGKCGKKIVISEGVYFDNPKFIEIGNNVWIDRNVILIAGKVNSSFDGKIHSAGQADPLSGKIIIGSNSHIGIGTILQGHGGISILDNFTTSPYCKIYSMSNNPSLCTHGTMYISGQSAPPVFFNQIRIEENVWLGLNVSVLFGTIGKNTFIKANSVVSGDIPENSIATGSPADRIKSRLKSE